MLNYIYSLLRGSRLSLLALLISLVQGAKAQAPIWENAAALFPVATNQPVIAATATDAAGNIFMAGSFSGTVSFGATSLTSLGFNDAFVAKWSPATGTFVWVVPGSSSYDDNTVSSLAVSGSNIYITGFYTGRAFSMGSVSLGNTDPNTANIRTSDAFVVKLTDDGTSARCLWAQRVGGLGSERGTAVAVSGTNVYVGGYTNGSSVTSGTTTLTGSRCSVCVGGFLAKFVDAGPSGSAGWARLLYSSNSDRVTQVAAVSNKVYVSGQFNGILPLGSTTLYASNNYDYYLTQLLDNGSSAAVSWATGVSGSGSYAETVEALAADAAGVYLTGNFDSQQLRIGTLTLANPNPLSGVSAAVSSVFVARVLDQGTTFVGDWIQAAGDANGTSTRVGGLLVRNANIYLTGYYSGTATRFGAQTLPPPPLPTTPGLRAPDVYVAKLTEAGPATTFNWVRQGGGARSETGNQLALNGTTLLVTGTAQLPSAFGTHPIPLPGAGLPSSNDFNIVASLTDSTLAAAQLRVEQGSAYYRSGATYDFGTYALNATSPPVTFRLANVGTAPLTLTDIRVSGDFALAGTLPSALPPGGSAPLALTCTPTQVGPRTGLLRLTSELGTYLVNLRGAAPYPAPVLTNMSPSTGTVGATVTLTGSNFVVGSTSVTLNGVAVPSAFVNSTGTAITLLLPAGATAGVFTVTTPGGTATSAPFCVTYTTTPYSASGCDVGPVALRVSGSPNVASSGYAWYTVPTGGTPLPGVTGALYSPVLSATTTYYVAVTTGSGSTACEGPRAAVTAYVTLPPTVTVTANGPLALCSGSSVTLTASGATSYFWSTGQTTASITVTTPGTYSVTGDINNCGSAYVNTTVTTGPRPAAPAVTGSSRCGSGALALVASGTPGSGGGYSWYTTSTGGASIAGATGATYTTPVLNATTTYYVSVRAASGCESTRVPVTATVNATPALSITPSGPLALCQGGAVTLTASGAGTYLWSTGATAASITVSAGGSYSVTVTNSAGCTATATATVTASPPTTATFAYNGSSFCVGGANPAPAVTGTVGGTFSAAAGLSLAAATGIINLSASTPGTYTVTYAVSGPCPSSATQNVTITAPATAAFSYPTTGSCAGTASTLTPALGTSTAGTFTLPAATGLSVNAATGVVTVSATAVAGTYTVTNTVAASGGCAAATSAATVTINALPATPTYTYTYPTPSTVHMTSSVAPAGTAYQWYLTTGTSTTAIAGATAQTYTAAGATAPGAYTVRFLSTATGCQSLPSPPLTVTSTAQPLTGTSLHLFPNPTADGRLTLELRGYAKAVKLTVIDALGRVLFAQEVAPGQTRAQLDLSSSAAGIYLLRAATDRGNDVRRIVRE
ncbi:hypothetical protein GCM10028822_18010 [Hymenobacter terrigena]